MKIGIVGSGKIGSTAARLFIAAGHEVAISNSRGPTSLQNMVQELGNQLKPSSVDGAAYFGEVVLLAIPFRAYRTLEPDLFSDRIVIDAMNYYPERDGHFQELDTGTVTSSELLALHLPEARIVKAFNTIYYQHLAQNGNKQAPLKERRAIFLAGDDQEAKRVVSGLIEEIGFAPMDTGSLAEGGRRQQPGTALYNQPLNVAQAEVLLSSAEV